MLFPASSSLYIQPSAFYEYIQNRYTEFDKNGKDWKFSIIQALHASPSRGLLSEEVNNTIETLFRQGAYYMPTLVAGPESLDPV